MKKFYQWDYCWLCSGAPFKMEPADCQMSIIYAQRIVTKYSSFFPHQTLPVCIPLLWYILHKNLKQSLYMWMCVYMYVWSTLSLRVGAVSLLGISLMLQTASTETGFSTFPCVLFDMFTVSSEAQFGLAFRHFHNNRI